jgi:hypothetical protein
MVPGPAIEVACSTSGGLSGGPAFDKNGKVFGILSASINDPDGRGPSQISMIWPALAMTISPSFLEHHMPARFNCWNWTTKSAVLIGVMSSAQA